MQPLRITRLLCQLPLLIGSFACQLGDSPSSIPDKADDLNGTADGCPVFEEPLPLARVDSSQAFEVSGLVASQRHRGLFWAHNDGDARDSLIFAVRRDGAATMQLLVEGIEVGDLEDIALGPGPDAERDYLYLADIGDNELDRESVTILRLPEPGVEGPDELELDRTAVESFELFYEDGKARDAEAMFVDPDTGDLFVLSKRGPGVARTTVFVARAPLFDQQALEVLTDERGAPELKGAAVAADLSADGRWLAVLFKDGPTRLWHREVGESIADLLERPSCHAPAASGQHEALALSPNGPSFYLLPEGSKPMLSTVHARPECPSYDVAVGLGVVDSAAVRETSGLVVSASDPNILWAVNDSGPGLANELVEIARTGEVLRSFEIPSAENVNWEDLATGPGPVAGQQYLYIGDIGDPDGDRRDLEIYRVAEPGPLEPLGPVERFHIRYPKDGHDAESLLVDPHTGDLYLITRQRDGDRTTRVYRAQAPFIAESTVMLEKVLDEDDVTTLKGDVVAADVSIDGRVLALARRDEAPLLLFRNPDGPLSEALSGSGCEAVQAPGTQDALALDRDSTSYFQLPKGQAAQLFRIGAKNSQ